MIVRVTGFTAELNTAKLGSNSGHMSMADELDYASEELREFGDWSGSKEIHVDDGDDPEEDRVNEAVTDEFNIAYLTVDHIDYDVIEPDDSSRSASASGSAMAAGFPHSRKDSAKMEGKLCPYTYRYCPAASGGRCHGPETCKEKRNG